MASHALDIRGAGNLLGDEQSGHIREVGVELYQHMLEETIASLRESGDASDEETWTPQISLGTSVLIPESYVADLSVRLGLYRRLSFLVGQDEIEAFAAEMIDRLRGACGDVGGPGVHCARACTSRTPIVRFGTKLPT